MRLITRPHAQADEPRPASQDFPEAEEERIAIELGERPAFLLAGDSEATESWWLVTVAVPYLLTLSRRTA